MTSGRGGQRKGAGRKPLPKENKAKRHQIYLYKDEIYLFEEFKKLIQQRRQEIKITVPE